MNQCYRVKERERGIRRIIANEKGQMIYKREEALLKWRNSDRAVPCSICSAIILERQNYTVHLIPLHS